MSNIRHLLTEHLDIWTAADTAAKSGRGRSAANAANAAKVYGISKLRELILELAVRGKLVPQDLNDEPASELLKRIRADKEKLAKDGKIKGENLMLEVSDKSKPFEPPVGWEWVRFGDVVLIERGGSPRPIKAFITNDKNGLNWIKISDADQGGKYITSTSEKIIKEGLSKTRMVYPGDFLLTNSMSFGRPYITKIEGCIHDGWLRISPPESIDKDYLYLLLSSPYIRTVFVAAAAGAVVMNLNADKVRDVLIPLPPLPEQHRIVAKVDELMALCDQLEAEHNNASAAHEKLVSQLLGTLTQTPLRSEPVPQGDSLRRIDARPSMDSTHSLSEQTEFEANWQRIAAHFDTLFTTEASIDALKQTLLQLAVMGKLVPQDPNDEPARLILELPEINSRKFLKLGKGSTIDVNKKITDIEKKFMTPAGWEWVRLGKIMDAIGGSQPPKSVFLDSPKTGYTRLIQIRDFKSDDFPTYVPNKFATRPFSETDIMIGRYGPPVFQILRGKNGTYNVALMKALPIERSMTNNFLFILLSEPRIQSLVISESERTAGQSGVRKELIYNFPVLLPPFEEQHRIVAKVDELMALCDQLKTQLIEAGTQQRKLADVLVKNAVA